MFLGVHWNHPVRPSFGVQNASFCQRAGGGIKSRLVTVLACSLQICLQFGPVLDYTIKRRTDSIFYQNEEFFLLPLCFQRASAAS